MVSLIEQHRAEIETLCRINRVKRLELFGSAARGDFDPIRSDIDFFYEFDPADRAGLVDRFFSLLSGLEELFHRRIDLVSLKSARNPYFLQSAVPDKITLHSSGL